MTPETDRLVTVIVPMYNGSTTIERALTSVLRQTYANWEVIVVDDASTDDSVQRVREAAGNAETDQVRVIELAVNAGSSAARNVGIDAASGEFLVFLDADDELLPEYLSVLTSACDVSTDIVVGGHILCSDGQEDRLRSSTSKGHFDGPTALERGLADRITPFPWDKLYRRDLFDGLRYPEGVKRFEDMMVNLTLYARARAVVVLDVPVYRYYVSATSLTWGRVTSSDDARLALAHLDRHLDPAFRSGRFSAPYRTMLTLVTLLVAQSAATADDGRPVDLISQGRSLTLAQLCACATVRPDLAAAGLLLKATPSLFGRVYRRYARRSYGAGHSQ